MDLFLTPCTFSLNFLEIFSPKLAVYTYYTNTDAALVTTTVQIHAETL